MFDFLQSQLYALGYGFLNYFFPLGVNYYVIEQPLVNYRPTIRLNYFPTPAHELSRTSSYAFCELSAQKRALNTKF